MDELFKQTLRGYIELKLNSGETLIGRIPFDLPKKKKILFLPEKNFNAFQERSKGNTVIYGDIMDLLTIIPITEVKSFIKKENRITGVKSENNKPIPISFIVHIENVGKLGYMHMKYSLPDNDKIFDLGLIKIEDDGQLIIPITFVFLSYAKEDKEIVKNTMEVLHDYGVLTWFDEKDLLPGDNWENKIEESIEKADYVFIFFSSNSLNRSGYKNKEIHFALNQKLLKPLNSRYIIPILIDDKVTPPREFNDIHWIKTTDENWISKILTAIGKN